MTIDGIELFLLSLPLRRLPTTPVAATNTAEQDELQTVLVRMRSGDTVGWGEASPGNGPTESEQWASGVFGCLRDWMAPAVIGTSAASSEALHETLDAFHGNRYAKAALDTAWWDLQARIKGKPLHELLGGSRDSIEVGTTLDRMESNDEFLQAVGRAFQDGYSRVRLVFRPGWDLQMVNAVRKEYSSETFHIDCLGGLGLDHLEMLCRLDDFFLAMIEQPLPIEDFVGHAMVQEAIRTPICLGASVTTPEQADMALELKSAQVLNIIPGRVGGLGPAKAIHDACGREGASCWVGALPQTDVGARASLAVASLAHCTYPTEFIPLDDLFGEDTANMLFAHRLSPELDASDGKLRVALWSEPGIGIDPASDMLDKYCIDRAAF